MKVIGKVTVSIDDDGFLRRECPHCEREFKWLHGDHGEPMPVGGYYCPYCGGRSEDGWWTRPQLAHMEAKLGGELDNEMHRMLKGFERSSSKSLQIRVTRAPRRRIPPVPDEPNDMRRVDFACHPAEPVKVPESWDGRIHCLLCGQLVAST